MSNIPEERKIFTLDNFDILKSENVKKIEKTGYILDAWNIDCYNNGEIYISFKKREFNETIILLIENHIDDEDINDYLIYSYYIDEDNISCYYGLESKVCKYALDLIEEIKANENR